MVVDDHLTDSFTEFVKEVEPRLKHALVAAAGVDHGLEATAEALAYGWEHWDELQNMTNPAGYLYRVGRTKAKRLRRTPPSLPTVDESVAPRLEPGLPAALGRLSERQRIAVVLIHCLEWTYPEVADLLGVSVSTVQQHAERGLRRLRVRLGVPA